MSEVVYVDGVRTAFGKAGPGGIFWRTRADDMAVKAVRELLRRNPSLPPERIGDVIFGGGVGHMGHHPMGDDVEFNPRFVAGRLIDQSAAVMGQTAENLHDRFPEITKERADRYAVASQRKSAAAWQNGVMKATVVPMAVFTDDGWKVAERDEFLRPDTTLEG